MIGDFSIEATAGSARAGTLETAHGTIRTPVFMPVGTKGTVKALAPSELEDLGVEIILGNTYHLHLRPGEEVVQQLGGLHRFMGWGGPILTDSGGFQVFSLRDTLLAVDEDGVTFRSVYDGVAERLTPERAMAIQTALGSDIAMAFDECPPGGAERAVVERGGRADGDLGRALRRRARAPGPAALRDRAGRRRSRASRAGRARRSPRSRSTGSRSAVSPWARIASSCSTTTERAPARCPSARPRYFMGIGDPEGICA